MFCPVRDDLLKALEEAEQAYAAAEQEMAAADGPLYPHARERATDAYKVCVLCRADLAEHDRGHDCFGGAEIENEAH